MLSCVHNFFVLSATTLAVIALTACDIALSPEEKRERARIAAGMDASVTAALLVSAARSCNIVGVSEVDKCAQIKGPLIADQSAQMMASIAVDQRENYWKKCQADLDGEYCNQLIRRAVAIELRKPKPSE